MLIHPEEQIQRDAFQRALKRQKDTQQSPCDGFARRSKVFVLRLGVALTAYL